MHRLDGPAALDELRRQIIEQLRMRRRLAARTEVVGSFHQALAKVILPNAIHHHAGRERILRPREPLRQFEAAAARGSIRELASTQNFKEAARHFIPQFIRLAPQLNPGVTRRPFADRIGELTERMRLGEVQRRKLHNLVQELRGNVRVFARVRPFLPSDGIDLNVEPSPPTSIAVRSDDVSMRISRPGGGGGAHSSIGVERAEDHSFTFDRTFGPSSSQESVFQEVSEFVQSALDGYNVCLFSYGQTGSGKVRSNCGKDRRFATSFNPTLHCRHILWLAAGQAPCVELFPGRYSRWALIKLN